jgi:hypothetical protein
MASGVTTSRPPAWRRRWPLVLGGTALLLLALLAAAGWWLLRGPAGPYADAMGTLPEGTLRSSFTDWDRVDEELEVPDVEEAQDADRVRDFLDAAYDADVVTGSTLLDVLPGLALSFGYSPAQAEWEAYGQSPDGAVDVLKVDDSVDFDEVAANLEEAGYDAPDDDEGVWRGSGDLVVELESPMTTIQINVLLLEEERLILTSDDVAYLETTRAVVEGDEPSLRGVPGVDPLVEASEEAVSAQLWSRDFACTDLAMSQADAIDQEEGARLVEEAGGVHPLDGLVVARTGGESATVAMWFDSEEDADHDLQPRTDLARGPAPGQGGDFSERFTVEQSEVDGRLVTMSIEPRTETLMGDLGQGPVLFAAC